MDKIRVAGYRKLRIIVDTNTGEQAVIGKLGEGDFGSNLGMGFGQALTRSIQKQAPVKVDFDYDALGNITNKREYGYQVSGRGR